MKIKYNLIRELCNPKYKKCHYEIQNILERLLISLVNNRSNKNKLFYKINFTNEFIFKAYNEILEKKEKLKHKYSKSQIKSIVEKIIVKIINNFVNTPPLSIIPKTIIKFDDSNFSINYLDINIKVNPNVFNILKKYPGKDVIIMIIRYSTLLLQGQQWGIPFEQYNEWYNNYDLRFEAFASPLNSRLMGKKNAYFCSIFYDTDKIFGSIGSFYDVSLTNPLNNNNQDKKVWSICPPYIDKILTYSAQKTIKALKEAESNNQKLIIFFVMPGWEKSESYIILSSTKYKSNKKKLEKNSYYYEYQGRYIPANFNSYGFVLESLKSEDNYEKVFNRMENPIDKN
ncbi:Phosphorylated CTD interacting factor 1 WW domain [seawater metagenome]|uniref:Phosphorylated CTD interacting factor 1 WW domain n=1 Tax=seawater metagenome TaxID=1561972 RepID=A0A5E8CJK8_9ZZZZ